MIPLKSSTESSSVVFTMFLSLKITFLLLLPLKETTSNHRLKNSPLPLTPSSLKLSNVSLMAIRHEGEQIVVSLRELSSSLKVEDVVVLAFAQQRKPSLIRQTVSDSKGHGESRFIDAYELGEATSSLYIPRSLTR